MKVAISNNSDIGLWLFRKGLIKALIARGIEVTLLTPDGPYVPKLTGLGAKHLAVPVPRFVNPARDLKLCFDLYRAFRQERPDIVHTMTIKPNIFGGLAARLARVSKTVALVNGLGQGFSDQAGWKGRMLRYLVSRLYRQTFNHCARVWFQNADDLAFFVQSKLIHPDKAILIRGSGVDVREHSPDNTDTLAVLALRAELGIDESARVVLMMARLMWSKGVRQFVEASRYLAGSDPPVVFLLAGPLDTQSPDAVGETYLRANASAHFRWLGSRDDGRELLSLADVVTLPSYYREGIPHFLLQALAMHKPIVTTNNVGCREVVDQGKNGFLVPVRDSQALATAIEKLIRDDLLRASFGRHSRAKAEAEFDEAVVVQRVLKEVYQLDGEFQDPPVQRLAAA